MNMDIENDKSNQNVECENDKNFNLSNEVFLENGKITNNEYSADDLFNF